MCHTKVARPLSEVSKSRGLPIHEGHVLNLGQLTSDRQCSKQFTLHNHNVIFLYFQFVNPEQSGYVGFANLPNQVHRKSVKKGFEFTLMVVGKHQAL